MTEIRMKLEKQVLTIQNQEVIAGGAVNYATCLFLFDREWEGYVKTAVFYQNKAKVQYAVLGSDGTCAIPAAAMAEEGNMHIGVFGVSGGRVITSTVERVYISKGAISGERISTEPGDDIFLAIVVQYQQIMEQMQAYDIKMEECIRIMNALNAYDVADVMERLSEAEENIAGMGDAIQEGISAVCAGLQFAQDGNGDWGYVVPGSTEVIPFGGAGENNMDTVFKRYPWQFIDGSEEVMQDGNRWDIYLEHTSSAGEQHKKYLFLAINVPQICKAIMTAYIGSSEKYTVFLNGEILVTNTNNSSYGNIKQIFDLKDGANYILIECYTTNNAPSPSRTAQFFLPPVAL